MTNSIILIKATTAKYLTTQSILSLRKVVKDFGLTSAIKGSTKLPKEGLVNALVGYVKYENGILTLTATVEPVPEVVIPVAPKPAATVAKVMAQVPSCLIPGPYPEPAPFTERVDDPALDVVPEFPAPFLTAAEWKQDALNKLTLSKLKELAKQRKDVISQPSKLSLTDAINKLLPLIEIVGDEVRVIGGAQVVAAPVSVPLSPSTAPSTPSSEAESNSPFTYGAIIGKLVAAEKALPEHERAAKAEAFKKKCWSFRVSEGTYPLLEDNPIPSPPSDENCPFNTGKPGCEFVQLLGSAPQYPLIRHDHLSSLSDDYLNWLIAEVNVCDYTYRCIPSIYERPNYLEFIHYKGQLDEEMLCRLNPKKEKNIKSIDEFRAEREKKEKRIEKEAQKWLEESDKEIIDKMEAIRRKQEEEHEKEMEKILEEREERRKQWEEARKKGEKIDFSFTLSKQDEEDIAEALSKPEANADKELVEFEVKFSRELKPLCGFDSDSDEQ